MRHAGLRSGRGKMVLLMVGLVYIGFSITAHATLINRGTDSLGNNLIYDTDLNITWYDYTKSADTWDDQRAWASGLSVTFGSREFDNWRLPVYRDPTPTSGSTWIINSEMGHLYATELGNLWCNGHPGTCQPGSGLINTGPFEHLLSDSTYWYGTDGTEIGWPTSFAVSFHTIGGEDLNDKNDSLYALAVRHGDVSPVPEPSTWLLMGAGLGLVGWRMRARPRFGKPC